jgi:hypothetical protein
MLDDRSDFCLIDDRNIAAIEVRSGLIPLINLESKIAKNIKHGYFSIFSTLTIFYFPDTNLIRLKYISKLTYYSLSNNSKISSSL